MDSTWYSIETSALVGIIVSALLLYLAVVLYVRLNGLRSFSKMASYDFAMTIAVGSILGGAIVSRTPSVMHAVVAIGALVLFQRILSMLRLGPLERALDNQPVMLMREGEFFEDAMRDARVTKADVIGKLREANVLRLEEVRAVILEVTGDISVLHGEAGDGVDDLLLDGVRVAD